MYRLALCLPVLVLACGPGGDSSVDSGSVDGGTGSDAAIRDLGSGDGGLVVDGDGGDTRMDAGSPPMDGGVPCTRFYLDPAGDDDAAGTSAGSALATLEEVEQRLVDDPPDCDVEVWIAPGLYREQRVDWRFTMPDHTITFRAADRMDRPVFDGCAADGSCAGGSFFILRHSAGEETNLHFWYLHVRNYQTAISLSGARNEEATSNGGNRIFGCYFERIGNVFDSSLDPSTACVRLVNSDDNEIANNHFVDVVNTRSGGLIHAIYVAHMSDRNTIRANRFLRSTGDPVRVRDYSNGNVITDNRFIRVGTHGGYTDWYCDHDARDDCTKPTAECPSWDNQFRDNLLDGTWACESLSAFHYFQDDATTGCAPPRADARRLRTSGNDQTASACSME